MLARLSERKLRGMLVGLDAAVAAVAGTSGSARSTFSEFAESNLWIKTKQGGVVPFRLNSTQRVYEARKAAHVAAGGRPWFLVLKYRQGGITTYEQGASYFRASRRSNQKCITLGPTAPKTQEIFEMVRLMYERDPGKPKIRGQANSKRFDFVDRNSVFTIATAGSDVGGRGGTYQRVHWTEVAKSCAGPNQIVNQRELYAGFSQAVEHGEFVLETTANGHDLFKDLWDKAKRGDNEFCPIFLPWYSDPSNVDALDPEDAAKIDATLSDEERDLVARRGLQHSQIKWRRRKIRELGVLFKQEHPEDDASCFLMTGLCFFDTDLILSLMALAADPIPGVNCVSHTQVEGGWLTVWEEPIEGEVYSAGMDTSEGNSHSDPNGVAVLKQDGTQVARLVGRYTPPALAHHGVSLCRRYRDALLGCEINNHGHAVMLEIQRTGYMRGDQLYYRVTGANATSPGWITDDVTRPIMLSDLAKYMGAALSHGTTQPGGGKINDRWFLSECLSFVKSRTGKYEAAEGKTDDLVVMWAIAEQMRRHPRRR